MTLATRTILSPNHYGSWEKGPPRAVVVHATRSTVSSKTDAQELQSTINWFTSVYSQASAHWVVSEVERVRMVEDKYPAWHAAEHSWEAYGIEVTQPTIDRPYSEGHYQNLVAVCVPYVLSGIPVVRLPTLEWKDGRRGFVGHEDTEQGRRDGKSDPGPQFDWTKFITMLGGEVNDMDEAAVRRIVSEMLSAHSADRGRFQQIADNLPGLNEHLSNIVKQIAQQVAGTGTTAPGLKRGDTVKLE